MRRRRLQKDPPWKECHVCGRRAVIKGDKRDPAFCPNHQAEEKAYKAEQKRLKEERAEQVRVAQRNAEIYSAQGRRDNCGACMSTGWVTETDDDGKPRQIPCPECDSAILDEE